MGRLDALTTELMRRPEIFADFFRMAFRGTLEVDSERLCEVDTHLHALLSNEKNGNRAGITAVRDLFKACVCFLCDETYYLLLGVENQTAIDNTIPVRVMLYDALTYWRQIREKQAEMRKNGCDVKSLISGLPKESRLHGIVSVVCYWGLEPWDGAYRLHDLLAPMPPEIKLLIPDYPVTIIAPCTMQQKQIDMLQTDLRLVFQCIRDAQNKALLRNRILNDPAFRDIECLVGDLINEVLQLKLVLKRNIAGKVNMCQAWKEILQDERDAALNEVRPQLALLRAEIDAVKAENDAVKAENNAVKAENDAVRANLREKGWDDDSIQALFRYHE